MNQLRKKPFIFHAALLSLALVLLAWVSISSLTFLSSDTGVRFLQIRELATHQWQTFAIDYPAQLLDPDWQFTPYYHSYALLDNQLYFKISHIFPLFASVLYACLGTAGLVVLPALGGVITAVAIYRLGILSKVKYPYWLFWATVFGTPLLIYTLELWDHSLAAACAAWGVYGAAVGVMHKRWQPMAWGGAAISVGLGQRPEMYPFALALGAALLISTWPHWRRWSAFVAGGTAATLPIWFWQYRWVGHPLGLAFAPNFFGYGLPNSYPVTVYNPINTPLIKIGHWLLHIEPHNLLTFAAGLLLILGILTLVFSLRVPAFQRSSWQWASLLFNVTGYAIYIVQAQNTLLHGFITTLPLAALTLAYLDKTQDRSESRPVYVLTLTTTGLFLGLMFAFWPAFGGVQWGVRYMLPAYPLLMLMAFYGFTVWYDEGKRPSPANTLHITFITLLAISFIVQAMGARYLILDHQAKAILRNMIRELPAELILTNDPFLASNMSSITDKQFMYVFDEQDIAIIVPRLIDANIHQFALFPEEATPITIPKQTGDVYLKQVSDFIYQLEIDTP